MMMLRSFVTICVAAALAGCGGGHPAVGASGRTVAQLSAASDPKAGEPDWRRVATPGDRERLRNWRTTMTAALLAARGVDGGMLAQEPLLFAPDRALADAVPPAGTYRCRVFKLGKRGSTAAGFAGYPFFECRVADEGEVVGFYKTSGSQRPVGLIFRDSPARAVFLGTMALCDERKAMQYGRDATRDMVGIVERIDTRRWRMVLPEPRWESLLDVIELVPAE